MSTPMWIGIAIFVLLELVILVFLFKTGRLSMMSGLRSSTPNVPPKPSESVPPPSPDTRIDKNVQFTVYRPATIVPEKWYPLVAFAHLSKRRDDAPKDEPDPIKEVQRLAARVLSDQPARYESTKLDRGFSVPEKGLLTFVPLVEGCEFNPPTQSVHWQKTVHKLEFDMRASASVDGQDVEGDMTVYLGHIILAEVPLRMTVDSKYVKDESAQDVLEPTTAEPYRKIFASYSHKDTAIVKDFENYVESLGDEYLRDTRTLRSGQKWSAELERMIQDASIFQLFWSSNSMISDYVKQEWEYALGLRRGNKFIRPVYWEEPLPKKDPDLPPKALSELHFYKLTGPEKEERRGGAIPPFVDPKDVLAKDNVPVAAESYFGPSNPAMQPVQSTAPARTTWLGPIQLKAAFAFIIFAFVAATVLLSFFMLRGTPPDPNPTPTPSGIPTPAPSPTIFGGDLPTVSPTVGPSPSLSPLPSPSTSPGLTPTPTPPTPWPARVSPIRVAVDPAVFKDGKTTATYNLTITNISPKPITKVVIREPLPEGVGFVSASPPPARDGSTLSWQSGEIASQGSMTISATLRLQRHLRPGEEFTAKPRTVINYVDGEGRQRTYAPRD